MPQETDIRSRSTMRQSLFAGDEDCRLSAGVSTAFCVGADRKNPPKKHSLRSDIPTSPRNYHFPAEYQDVMRLSDSPGKSHDHPLRGNLRVQKVNDTGRLSPLARWILLNVGDGLDRADIVARYFGIDRLYKNFYVDPCYRPKQRREHDRKFRRANPRVTMALKRLEKAGLVRLIRRNKYAKRILLAEKGKTMSNTLSNSDRSKRSNGR